MAQCRIGLLTNYRFGVYLFSRNRLQKELDLPLADLDGEAFQRYLESIATHPLYLLLDLLGEEFRVEQLPHVSGRDRSEVYRRKLQQFFPTASLSQARLQLQEKHGRKDDRVLFTAVGGVGILDHLLSDLARQHIPLAAIYSLPLAMESLLKRVGPQAHTLIVHEIKDDVGNIILFRQSYYQAGKLALSRLNRIGSQSAEAHIQDLFNELARTRRYLVSSKLLSPRETLPIYFLLNDMYRKLFSSAVSGLSNDFRLVAGSCGEFAREIGLKGYAPEDGIGRIMAHAVARGQVPGRHYRPPHVFNEYRLMRIHQSLIAASFVAGTLGLTGGLFNLYNVSGISEHRLSLQITEASNQLLLLGRDPPQLDAPPAQVEAAVRIADQVRRGAAVPDTLFRVISLSLHGFADLKIDELAWGEQIQAGSSNSPAAETATLDPLLNDPAMNGAAIPESGITMRLRGVQSPFNGDLRRAIARIESYVDRLRNLPEVMEVEVLQLPLDVTPTSSLSGEVGSGRKAESKAQFEIRLKVRMEQDDTAETSA